MSEIRSGHSRGTGAAINVELGWIPDLVILFNATDRDLITIGHPMTQVIPFTSGGTNEIIPGHLLIGATSGAKARVTDVITDSGTWAAGDAAGWIFIDVESKVGTFTTENFYYQGSSGTNDATGVLDLTYTTSIDTEVAGETTTSMITPYVGSPGTAALGFTIGSSVSEDAKLLHWIAIRSGGGQSNRLAGNSL